MQQLKIEVRVRDDEARAKRSTVERGSAEHFKEKSQMGSRTKGKHGEMRKGGRCEASNAATKRLRL